MCLAEPALADIETATPALSQNQKESVEDHQKISPKQALELANALFAEVKEFVEKRYGLDLALYYGAEIQGTISNGGDNNIDGLNGISPLGSRANADVIVCTDSEIGNAPISGTTAISMRDTSTKLREALSIDPEFEIPDDSKYFLRFNLSGSLMPLIAKSDQGVEVISELGLQELKDFVDPKLAQAMYFASAAKIMSPSVSVVNPQAGAFLNAAGKVTNDISKAIEKAINSPEAKALAEKVVKERLDNAPITQYVTKATVEVGRKIETKSGNRGVIVAEAGLDEEKYQDDMERDLGPSVTTYRTASNTTGIVRLKGAMTLGSNSAVSGSVTVLDYTTAFGDDAIEVGSTALMLPKDADRANTITDFDSVVVRGQYVRRDPKFSTKVDAAAGVLDGAPMAELHVRQNLGAKNTVFLDGNYVAEKKDEVRPIQNFSSSDGEDLIAMRAGVSRDLGNGWRGRVFAEQINGGEDVLLTGGYEVDHYQRAGAGISKSVETKQADITASLNAGYYRYETEKGKTGLLGLQSYGGEEKEGAFLEGRISVGIGGNNRRGGTESYEIKRLTDEYVAMSTNNSRIVLERRVNAGKEDPQVLEKYDSWMADTQMRLDTAGVDIDKLIDRKIAAQQREKNRRKK